MATNLTQNAISSMLSGKSHIQPFLQIVELERITSMQSSTIRYRTTISDGTHMKHLILPITYNDLVEGSLLQKGSIIHVKNWTTSTNCPSM